MPEKKSLTSKVSERRMSKPQAPRPTNGTEPVSHSHSAAAAVPATSPPSQLGTFEAAMRLFHARNFQEARGLFALAATGSERDIANRARMHKTICDRRLEQATVNLGSAEDYYNYGVALINSRNLGEARTHLEKAMEMTPDCDHIHYALALAQALDGDVTSAQQNLKRAIELEPRNRLIARQDADFAPLANQPPLDALIYPEKKSW